ncbi:TonB-dependent receptor domain-containing protein [Myroides sp. LJL119]
MKYFTFWLIAFILISQKPFAQNSFKTIVINKDSIPLDFVDVRLTNTNTKQTSQTYSNQQGEIFIKDLANANYKLELFYFNNALYQKDINMNKDVSIPYIIIDDHNILQEMVITSEKKLIERKIDRLVYNTSASISSTGMSALETLENIPMVKVDNDQVSLVGKSTVQIMINDRITYLTGSSLTNYLKSLSSDDIEKIEVITTPPAKYDAAGRSGLINIVLKKSNKQGVFGSLGGSYAYYNRPSYMANTSINYQNKKWNISLIASGNEFRSNSNYMNNFYSENSQILQKNNSSTNSNSSTAFLTVNYDFTPKTNIGLSYNLGGNKSDIINYRQSNFLNTQVSSQSTISKLQTKDNNNSTNHTLNVFLNHQIDTLGSKLHLGVNYFSNLPTNKTYFFPITTQISPVFTNLNKFNLDYQVANIKADVELHRSWAKIEFGAKYTHYNNKTNNRFFLNQDNVHQTDTTKTNHFNYKEYNYAGYFSISKELTEDLEIQVGLRYENTHLKGHLIQDNSKFSNTYGKFFPSFFLSYSPWEKHDFSANYSVRIDRPSPSMLNPFKIYSDENTYTEGNPYLSPSYSNNIEINYLFNNLLSLTFNYNKVTDGSDYLSEINGSTIIEKYKNILNSETYDIEVSYNGKTLQWWETNTSIYYYYINTYFKSPATQVALNGGTVMFNSQNTFNLNSKKNLYLLVNYFYMPRSKEDNTKYSSQTYTNIALKASLLDSKLTLMCTLRDVFNQSKNQFTMYFKDHVHNSYNYHYFRRLTISANYRFGNSKNKKAIKQADFEEKQRIN